MSDNIVGIVISAPNASAALDQIVKAEELGIKAAWATSGGAGGDALAVFAAAAARTENILLGTSVMQTWSRHPVATIQQKQTATNADNEIARSDPINHVAVGRDKSPNTRATEHTYQ